MQLSLSAMSDPWLDRHSQGGVEMITRSFAAVAAAVLLSASASAEQIPDWNLDEICRGDSAPGQCKIFEAEARRTISGSWHVLPPEVRSTCLTSLGAPQDRSWRLLAGCIEGEVLRAKADHAIATRLTPAEPKPAPIASPEPEPQPPTAEPASSEAAPAPGATAPASSDAPEPKKEL